MRIAPDDLTHPDVIALLREHLGEMHAISPPESVHALDLDRLRTPDVSFFTVWDDRDTLLGCGALKALGDGHGEVKSMRTPAARRGQGAGRAMLAYLIGEARRRGYTRLSLETGSTAHFAPAQRLYASAGFVVCGPFGGYTDDPHSLFMTLRLA